MKRLWLRAHALEIPFTYTVSHASATRSATQTLWVEIVDRDGHCGVGEGCPRDYVTGESLQGALAFVAAHADEWCREIVDVTALRCWVNGHRELIDANAAAWCAVELAFLDLFGQREGRALEALLDLPPLSGAYRYTAVLGDAAPSAFEHQLSRYVETGFRDFKIKLGANDAWNRAKLAALRASGIDPARVRADANNLWRRAQDAVGALQRLDYAFAAVEEPVTAGDIARLAAVGRALDTAIVLDESLTRLRQLAALSWCTRWVVNVRVSKMGGLLRAIDVATAAAARGLPIIVGAHVGETSVLTRAALAVVQSCRPSVIAQEGAFGRHLLLTDVVRDSLTFGAGGLLASSAVPRAPGLGLDIVSLPARGVWPPRHTGLRHSVDAHRRCS